MPWCISPFQLYWFPTLKEGILAHYHAVYLYDEAENCVKYGVPSSVSDPVFEAGNVKMNIVFRDDSTDQYTFREVRLHCLIEGNDVFLGWYRFDQNITKNAGQTLTIALTLSVMVG